MGNSIWDDPEWDALRNRVNGRAVPKPARKPKTVRTDTNSANAQKAPEPPQNTPKAPKKVHLSLDLSLPKVKPPKISKKQLKIGLASTAIIAVSLVGSLIILNRGKPSDSNDVLSDTEQKPSFDTVLPNGKEDETTGGKVGYSPEKKVASFTDTIGTASITVSQQELPETFKANPEEEVKKLAESFSATVVINESNPKAYLGNDVSGAQSVIFHKNGLLVFILSNKAVEKDQWAEYITKLL